MLLPTLILATMLMGGDDKPEPCKTVIVRPKIVQPKLKHDGRIPALKNQQLAIFHGISLDGKCRVHASTVDAKTAVVHIWCERDDVPYDHF